MECSFPYGFDPLVQKKNKENRRGKNQTNIQSHEIKMQSTVLSLKRRKEKKNLTLEF